MGVLGDGWHLGIFGRIFSAFRARASGPSTIACQVGGGVVCARQEGWRIFGGGLSREIPPASKQGVFLAVAEYIPCTDRHNFYHHAEHGRGRAWINISDFGTSQGC